MDPAYQAALDRAQRNLLRQDYEKTMVAERGRGNTSYEAAGPPTWSRAAWDAFHAQYGFYPFGNQDGTQVLPSTFEGAPDWVYELMGLRKPPVTVTMRAGNL